MSVATRGKLINRFTNRFPYLVLVEALASLSLGVRHSVGVEAAREGGCVGEVVVSLISTTGGRRKDEGYSACK